MEKSEHRFIMGPLEQGHFLINKYSFNNIALKMEMFFVPTCRSQLNFCSLLCCRVIMHPAFHLPLLNLNSLLQKEQKYSEIQSALVNKAYKTLLKPLSRGLYMVSEIHLMNSLSVITARSACLMARSRETSRTSGGSEERSIYPVFQLKLEGMRIEEGTDAGADSQFLMELMEINEALDQARTSEEADKIGQDTKGKHVSLLSNRLKA